VPRILGWDNITEATRHHPKDCHRVPNLLLTSQNTTLTRPCDAAEQRLLRYGYKNLNLGEIVRELGISKTSLYKTVDSKYMVASKVVDRLLARTGRAMSNLIQSDLPLPEKLARGLAIMSNAYIKLDREFLRDLETSLRELWDRIDAARRDREGLLAALIAREPNKGVARTDIDASILAAMLLTLVRVMCNPSFFLANSVTSDVVAKAIVDVFLEGTLES
jgi:AcrR family transcriptional regulator